MEFTFLWGDTDKTQVNKCSNTFINKRVTSAVKKVEQGDVFQSGSVKTSLGRQHWN